MRKFLLSGILTIITCVGLLTSSMVYGQATLKHSYTFEEGTYDETTVYDQTGSLNGTLTGDAISIDSGKCVVSGATTNTDGYVVFDGVALDLASYTGVSLEAFLETGDVLNSTYTMLAYFGSTSQGQNCFWVQPTRAATETRIEANNGTSTISAILGGYEVDDGLKHHLVAILDADALTYYLDGVVIAETSTGGADYVSTIGTDIAQLFKGPDGWPDPNYNCWLEEFNIYDGTLDQYTIAQRAGTYLGLDLTNAGLDTLTISTGTMEPAFDPETDIYEITVPYGTTSITVDAVPNVGGVSITITDGLGNEVEDGIVTFDKDDGIDFELTVTALDGVTQESFIFSVWPEAGEESATLENIQLSVGSLTTDFNMDDTAYVAIVPAGTTSVDVTGIPNWSGATVEGGGTVTLTDGMGSATLTVTSEDGNATKVYTVDISASPFMTGQDFYVVHELSGFVAAESGASFNQVILADAAYQDSSQIWQFEESGVEGQYYIKNKAGNYICLSRTSTNTWDLEVYPDLPAVGLDSARFILNEFEPGRFRIISVRRQQVSATNNMMGPNNGNLNSPLFSDKWFSTANDPLTVFHLKKPEEVVSQYDLHLSNLSIDGVSLKPTFNPAYKEYLAVIPVGMNSVNVSATARDTVTPPIISGTGNVDVSDGEGTITITVTAAADAQYTREYVINYLSDTELTLTHSYTFDDGTAMDQVGNADGDVQGGTLADSAFTSTEEGDYIILPAEEIALNTYPTFTMETYVMTGANPGWTMFTYFGNTSGGSYCYFMSLAGDNNQARAVLNLGDGEVQAASTEPGAGELHHYVSVVTNDTLYWYVDGVLAQKTANRDNYSISDIAGSNAWLGFGAYNDPTWLGTIYEYNIYSGQMDAATVAQRAAYFLGDISTDNKLASLTVDVGELLPAFDPAVTNYSVILPEGTDTVHVTAVANDEKATLVGDGAVDVSSGSANAAIIVTAENGAQLTYNVSFSIPEEYTLMHSYTFDDGTANDVVGTLDGLVVGNVTIADGKATVDTAASGAGQDYGYISLDGASLGLSSYSAITTEAFIVAGDGANDWYTMLYYFGDNTTNYLFSQMTQGDTDANVKTTGAGGEVAAWNGSIIDDGQPHHIVAVVTSTSVKFYVDGVLVGTGTGEGLIAPIGTLFANLFRGPDGWNDDNWIGSIDEFNIYEGEMDAATIAERATDYLEGSVLTLMHSYTFDDGTADDVVGDADGTLMDGATIVDGSAVLNAAGQYVSLDAATIAINTYSSVTVEAFITASNVTFGGNGNATLFYFGNTIDTWKGYDYLYVQGTTGNGNSTNAFSTPGNVGDPWAYEDKVSGPAMNDSSLYHVVVVIENSTMTYYVNGVSQGSVAFTGTNALSAVGTELAWIGKAGYQNDPTFQASIDEFNIYQGAMDASTIAQRAEEYLAASDASLSGLTVDVGIMEPKFDPSTTSYNVTVPEGTTSVNVTATPSFAGSTVVGDGAVDVSSGSGSTAVVVTSEDGTMTKTYTVKISTPGEVTLMHSYTFEDGTAADVVGDADGILMGNGTIANGTFTAAADGDYIELPASQIAINTYAAITLEAYVTTGVNDGWTMLAYFGSMGGWPSYWISIARADDVSMTTVDAGAGAFSTSGAEPAAGEKHHYVSVLTDSTIALYIDGVMVSSRTTPENTTIAGITNDTAFIGKGGYPDPTWNGDVHEFNIYEGTLDAITIAENAEDFLAVSADASLADLMLDGVTIDNFNAETMAYDTAVSQVGGPNIPVVTATASDVGAMVEVVQATEVPGTATITVTAEDGVTQQVYTVDFTIPVSAGDILEGSIKVYPTYSDGNFKVETNGSHGMITIYNMVGKLVAEKVIESNLEIITVRDRGMYIMKVENEHTIGTFKVFKTR